MADDVHLESADKGTELNYCDLPVDGNGVVITHRWMLRSFAGKETQPALNANQRTSLSAMISYISTKSGQSEFRLERKLSDRFNIPNPKCLPANDFDAAIRYLADILSA